MTEETLFDIADNPVVVEVEERSAAMIRDSRPGTTGLAKQKNRSKSINEKGSRAPTPLGEPLRAPPQLKDAKWAVQHSYAMDLSPLLISCEPVVWAMDRRPNSCNAIPCPGVTHLAVNIECTKEGGLMDAEMQSTMLPVEITVLGGNNLPAVPGPYAEMDTYYQPVHASYKFFGYPNTITTHGCRHGEKVSWNHRKVFLIGRMNVREFSACVQTQSMELILRDRDYIKTKKVLVDTSKKGSKPGTAASKKKPADESAGKQASMTGDETGDESSSRATTRAATALSPPAFDLEDTDNLYGVCRFHLGDLFLGAADVDIDSSVLPVFPAPSRDPKGHETRINPYGISPSRPEAAQVALRLRVLFPLVDYEDEETHTRLGLPHQVRHPYRRAVYIFNNSDSARLRALLHFIADANAKALGMENEPRVALAGVQLTDEQLSLDLLTGFHVTDAKRRIVGVEGVSNAWAFKELIRAVPRAKSNDSRLLCNDEITFPARIYGSFNVEPRTIKLRRPLDALVSDSNLFLLGRLPPVCGTGLNKLSGLADCSRLRDAQMYELFPSALELLAVEKKFGGFVSDADLARRDDDDMPMHDQTSDLAPAPLQAYTHDPMGKNKVGIACKDVTILDYTDARDEDEVTEPEDDDDEESKEEEVTNVQRRRQSMLRGYGRRLDSLNTDYTMRRSSTPIDHVQAHIEKYKGITPAPRRRGYQEGEQEIFMYSGQRLRFSEVEKEKLRRRLAKNPHMFYAYSEEFISLAFNPYDEAEIQKQTEALHRSMFITKEGIRMGHLPHFDRLGEARRQELETEWVENALRQVHLTHTKALGEKDFMIPAIPDTARVGFGIEGNPDFFKSVMSGNEQEQALIELQRKEKEEWLKKVVVDNINFRVYLGQQATAGAFGEGMLKDPPHKLALKYIRSKSAKHIVPTTSSTDQQAHGKQISRRKLKKNDILGPAEYPPATIFTGVYQPLIRAIGRDYDPAESAKMHPQPFKVTRIKSSKTSKLKLPPVNGNF